MTNKTDKLIRQKLHAYESTFSASVLDGVLSSVNEVKDNRKYPIWIWMSFSLLILIIVSGLVSSFISSKKEIAAHPSSIEENSLAENRDEFILGKEGPNDNLSKMATIVFDSTNNESISNAMGAGINTFEKVDIEKSMSNEKLAVQPTFERTTIDKKLGLELRKEAKNKVELVSREALSLQKLSMVFNQVNTQSAERKLKEPIGCPNFSEKERSPIFIEAYISHDMPFRSLSSNSTESQVDYISRRDETESATYSFHTGVRVSSKLISNFVLRVGIDYAQITEKFKVSALESTREVIVRDADGNIISTTMEQGTRDVVNYNKFKSYNIPVSLGWQSRFGKLGFAIHAGAAMSMVSSHNGVILEPGLTLPMARIISSGSDSELAAFKNDHGISAIGSIGVSYPFRERIDFVIEPNIKYILNPINLTSYPVEQRMYTVGVLTGIRYKF